MDETKTDEIEAAWARYRASLDALRKAGMSTGRGMAEVNHNEPAKVEMMAACDAVALLHKDMPEAARQACVDRIAREMNEFLAQVSWDVELAAAAAVTPGDLGEAFVAMSETAVRVAATCGRELRDLRKEWGARLTGAAREEFEGFAGSYGFDAPDAPVPPFILRSPKLLLGIWSVAAESSDTASAALLARIESQLPPEPAARPVPAIDDPAWRAFLARAEAVTPSSFEKLQAELGSHLNRLIDEGHDARVVMIDFCAHLPRVPRLYWAERIDRIAEQVAAIRAAARSPGGAERLAKTFGQAMQRSSPRVRELAMGVMRDAVAEHESRQQRRRRERKGRGSA